MTPRRLALVLLALVFLLNAADPTPRFLGFRRAAWLKEAGGAPAQARHILPKFNLPPAVKPASDDAPSAAQTALAAPAPLASVLLPALRASREATPRSVSGPAPGRHGTPPPLRC